MPGIAWFLFFGGVGALLISADSLVKAATVVAGKLKLSPLIMGTTVVAIGTSLPELAVSMTAAIEGDEALAVGNIIGSNTTNLLLVLPLAIMLSPVRIGTTKTQRNALIMLVLTLVFAWMLAYYWNMLAGLMLLSGSAVFSFMEYKWGVYGRKHEDKKQIKTIHSTRTGVYFKLLLALAGVLAGGYLTVMGAERIADDLKLTTSVIGLTLVALATSLPEIMVTVMSGIKGQAKMAVGNILGSNIYNILLIGGGVALVTKEAAHRTQGLYWFAATAILMAVIIKLFAGRNVPKLAGMGLLGLYGMYVWLMVS